MSKLAEVSKGHPQKLPNLHKENRVAATYTKKKTINGMWRKVGLNSALEEIKTFTMQAKAETSTKIIKRACLLKSITFAVQGRKNKGNKKIRTYIEYLDIRSNIFVVLDVLVISYAFIND